ncbi:hypothetical protein ACQ4PT_046112 [Festuca glaucescens]
MDRFKRLAYVANAQGGNGSGVSCEISEPAALSSCTFSCLRKVTLRFNANELDCFPVQLSKYLVENAMVLKEMHVDDGVTTEIFKAATLSIGHVGEPFANGSIELDMPSLRTFRYDGCQVKLSLTSPTPALEQTDLKICNFRMKQCEPVSRVLRSFSSTRGLTLRNQGIEDIVAGEEDDILPTFPNLKILVLDGCYKYMNNDTALAMARLLSSCPVISELRLRLSMLWNHGSKKDPPGLAFSVSMDRFNRFAPMDSVQGSNDIGVCNEISELTALSSCTLSCLRKVTLRFEAKELNCFPVQLAKFLTENAMDLEEMHADDGSQFWADHVTYDSEDVEEKKGNDSDDTENEGEDNEEEKDC